MVAVAFVVDATIGDLLRDARRASRVRWTRGRCVPARRRKISEVGQPTTCGRILHQVGAYTPPWLFFLDSAHAGA